MSNELIYSDATELAELIRNKEVSPVEVMQARLGPYRSYQSQAERNRRLGK
jgi:aspartyl-tRNA(Asn)/glutamyl-tRNA(Gln) amidotransferase subunit A